MAKNTVSFASFASSHWPYQRGKKRTAIFPSLCSGSPPSPEIMCYHEYVVYAHKSGVVCSLNFYRKFTETQNTFFRLPSLNSIEHFKKKHFLMTIVTCIYHRKFGKYRKVQGRIYGSPIILSPKYNSIASTWSISSFQSFYSVGIHK